jgi:hypothetical protein
VQRLSLTADAVALAVEVEIAVEGCRRSTCYRIAPSRNS